MSRRRLEDVFADLPPEWPHDPATELWDAVTSSGRKVVVLDDDPTGTQTVHDVPVLADWSVDALAAELLDCAPAVFILTNSRSLPATAAEALNRTIGQNLRAAAERTGRRFIVISRSDSTLRGHFPGEVAALEEGLGSTSDAWVLMPFFEAGGRLTIRDIHYVREGDDLVPAAETAFARDEAFGYRHSDLREWAEEKTGGRIKREQVTSISLEDLRTGGSEVVAERLVSSRQPVIIINAAAQRDLEVAVLALLHAEANGRQFLYRTAASFVQVRAGIASRALLTAQELVSPRGRGGLIICGSHVPKSTEQLRHLRELPGLRQVEIAVSELLDPTTRGRILTAAQEQIDTALAADNDVVVFTSRDYVGGGSAEQALSIGHSVSEALVSLVQTLTCAPRYLIAKGGITSNDIAVHGLQMKRGTVVGQILPGVPVWRMGEETRHPGLHYVVFPGNVGSPTALAELAAALKR
jgi:uncharacterized protein YgbK (DUF1537 family)